MGVPFVYLWVSNLFSLANAKILDEFANLAALQED